MTPDKGKRSKGSRKPVASTRVPAGKHADRQPSYVVRWHPDAAAERSAAWPDQEKVAMLHAVQKLQAVGPRLPFPHCSAVHGPSGQGPRELRPRAGRSRWRPLYRQVGPETFMVLAVAPEVKIDAAGFDAAVQRAVKRLAETESG